MKQKLVVLVLGLGCLMVGGCDGQSSATASEPGTGTPSAPVQSTGPVSTPTQTTVAPAPPDPMLAEVLLLTNQARVAAGAPTLVWNGELGNSAQGYAVEMNVQNFFSHTAPDGTGPADRIAAAGYTGWTTWGENIAQGYATAAEVMNAWMNSPGHRANILNPAFLEIGIGYSASGNYWVQDFGAR